MFVDVQASLLFFVVTAWEEDFTGYILDYGTFPDQRRQYFTLRDARHTLTAATKASGLGSVRANARAGKSTQHRGSASGTAVDESMAETRTDQRTNHRAGDRIPVAFAHRAGHLDALLEAFLAWRLDSPPHLNRYNADHIRIVAGGLRRKAQAGEQDRK